MNITALRPSLPHVSTVMPRPNSSTPTVMVADDETNVRHLMARMLNLCGIAVVSAENGNEAWEMFNEMPRQQLSALVTDMDMPGKNGLELSLLIREANPDLPVLMVSGNFDEDLAHSLMACRRVFLLRKPFTLEQFRTVMQKVLPEHRAA